MSATVDWTGFALTERGGVGTEAAAAGRFFRTTTRGCESEVFCVGMTSPFSVSSTTAGIVNVFTLTHDEGKREERSSLAFPEAARIGVVLSCQNRTPVRRSSRGVGAEN